MNKKDFSESDIKAKFITPAILNSGWDEQTQIGEVYDTFKLYFNNHKDKLGTENIVKSLYEYSQYYVAIALQKEEDKTLKSVYKEITKLRMDTSYPFLLAVYGDYNNELRACLKTNLGESL
ncbi:hypothetical protein [Gillisia sp. Hel_I_86]|uniref:hypothetical protein n=1 Tax=Gillisia sp. Hel_I_86 TaxID=1249981 RepID=UPI00119D6779|nr:hypothetical protein [Gillisia sp. Hel_I_86]